MQYNFKNKEGVIIEATPERWQWGIIYNDGTELKQFGDDGWFHQVGEIKQENIAMAVLYKMDDPGKRIDIPWRSGMKLIHKYINIILSAATTEERRVRIYAFGYKYKGQCNYIYILPDDRLITSPEDDVDFTKFNI